MRLAKYARRGFEVMVPSLKRDRVDPNIYERPWSLLQGLARLLVLEQLGSPSQRAKFRAGGDIKKFIESERDPLQERIEKLGGSAEESDYSTVFLPWGPDVTAAQIARTMMAKDRKLNSSWFTHKRPYLLHPCFIGTAEDILQDCSPEDPPYPDDVPEELVQQYVRGPLSWITDNPGRQQIGSFNPTTTGDWEDGAYFLETTETVCTAANNDDTSALQNVFSDSLSKEERRAIACQRDFFGRCPLHIAVMSNSVEAVKLLLANGARPEYRLPDGRNVLHLCAQYNASQEIVDALLQRGKQLQEEEHQDAAPMQVEEPAEVKEADNDDEELADAHKPFSMHDFVNNKGYGSHTQLPPLNFAILCDRLQLVKALLLHGASAEEKVQIPGISVEKVSCLLLANPSIKDMVPALVQGGASPASFSGVFLNTYHLCAQYGLNDLMKCILEVEQEQYPARLKKALNVIGWSAPGALYTPITLALEQGNLEGARLLYTYGAKLQPDTAMCDAARSRAANYSLHGKNWQIRQGISALKEAEPSKFMSNTWRILLSFCRVASVSARSLARPEPRGNTFRTYVSL